MIKADKLTKKFTTYKKEPGLSGAIKSFYQRDAIHKYAVKDFDLDIKSGEIIGLLGPNGAGKTTLMKMFTGIIVPSSGEIVVAGHVPSKREKAFRKKIALVMGQKSQLWWDIPALDSFLLLQKYYEVPDSKFNKKINEMGEMLGVTELFDVHVRKLSLGERMKLELMASLLHEPEVLFLDEPTIGLDLIAQENIRNFIKEYHEENNLTVILTSHYMQDVQALCKDLVLIAGGEKAFDGPLKSFEKVLGHKKSVYFTFKDAISLDDQFFKEKDVQVLKGGREIELKIDESDLRDLSSHIIQNYPVIDFHTEKIPIEKVMKSIMKNPEILNQ